MEKDKKITQNNSSNFFSNCKIRNLPDKSAFDEDIYWYNYRSSGMMKKIENRPDSEKIRKPQKIYIKKISIPTS